MVAGVIGVIVGFNIVQFMAIQDLEKEILRLNIKNTALDTSIGFSAYLGDNIGIGEVSTQVGQKTVNHFKPRYNTNTTEIVMVNIRLNSTDNTDWLDSQSGITLPDGKWIGMNDMDRYATPTEFLYRAKMMDFYDSDLPILKVDGKGITLTIAWSLDNDDVVKVSMDVFTPSGNSTSIVRVIE